MPCNGRQFLTCVSLRIFCLLLACFLPSPSVLLLSLRIFRYCILHAADCRARRSSRYVRSRRGMTTGISTGCSLPRCDNDG
jgi:hypothetical protein